MSCCDKPCGTCEGEAGSRLSPGRRDSSVRSTRIQAILAGNPNCGKSTLFNALTGARQRTGNWSGVTVECQRGELTHNGAIVEIVDLPGVYSLSHAFDSGALDECAACEFIMTNEADVIVNIVDASHLERHLYFTVELLELGLPVIVALNMMDAARANGLQINTALLAARLGCPVVVLEAHKGYGMTELKRAMTQPIAPATLQLTYPDAIEQAVEEVARMQHAPVRTMRARAMAIRLLEGDDCLEKTMTPALAARVVELRANIQTSCHEDLDILLADTRFRFIQEVLAQTTQQVKHVATSWTQRIDHLVLNRFLGIPIFLGVMYLLFASAINVGGYFQHYFEVASQAVLVDGVAHRLLAWHAPAWLIALLAEGVGKGLSTTLTFVPVLGVMFLLMAFLEDSGYMARAAFVVDRVMRWLGLPGKAFVPMIVGFGCNVPAVMAARTLDNQRDRIITVMMTPFMSCGARLAIYAVFTAAFFPEGGQNIVFALYLVGVLAAVLTGFMLRKTVLQGEPAPLLMELPAYHLPQPKNLLLHAWQRLHGFVIRAGSLIVPVCALFGVLSITNAQGVSLLSILGTWLVPIFSPLGVHADNWPAAVGLLTGVLAKEVVVGSLNTLYAQVGTTLAVHFDGQVGAFAYLLFVLLYFPCVSTLGAMLRELPRRWAVFSAVWTTGIAYCIAVMFYQAATLTQHYGSSVMWLLAIVLALGATIAGVRYVGADKLALRGEAV